MCAGCAQLSENLTLCRRTQEVCILESPRERGDGQLPLTANTELIPRDGIGGGTAS